MTKNILCMTDFDIFYQNRGSVITYYTTKKYVVAKGLSQMMSPQSSKIAHSKWAIVINLKIYSFLMEEKIFKMGMTKIFRENF